jgi:starch-binding outer membrane protein, SusD/RagB family
MRRITSTLSCLALAGLVGLAACDLDVEDLNNPGLDELSENPTPSGIAAACTGLLIGNRTGTAAANGYVSQLGILGRESYNFDAADPRYVGELLAGPLNPGSPFGGNFWAAPYANIRLAEIILDGVDQVAEFEGAPASAIKGFVHTIKALDLLRVINTRDTIGAVIDTDNEGVDDLGAIASKEEVLGEIASLLDQGAEELAEGGEAFPFPMHSGYSGFDTPATFLTFNRAIRARVAVYMEDYDAALDALAESFIDETASMDLGVYHSYSTGSGDATNGLTNPNIYAHPSIVADAQEGDTRVDAKVVQVPEEEAGGAQGLTSDLKFTMYTSPESPVPIIRNEELILLRAEANWGNGDLAAAIDDLNVVRAAAGLAALPPGLDAMEVEDEILYNRRYSLLFEGGHRWIDLRRFDRLDELPIDLDGLVINVRYPLPSAECDGRPGEPACAETSM